VTPNGRWPVVDVVVLTWNDGVKLDPAVSSALASADVHVRVVVVDNGSEPPATVPDDPRVRLVRNQVNRGVAAGRNQGVALGEAPLVCLLDSDAQLHPAALSTMAARLLDDPGVALVVPTYMGQSPEASAGKAPSGLRKIARGLNLRDDYAAVPRNPLDRWWDVEFGIGACQLFRRKAYAAVNGIDESWFYGPEDVDFCLRLRAADHRVVQVADELCDHPPRRRFRRVLTRRGLDHSVAIAAYLWRHRGHARIPVAQQDV
jgi:GT2 family glycosyltransferase